MECRVQVWAPQCKKKSGFTAESLEEGLEEHLWCEERLRLEREDTRGVDVEKFLLGRSEGNQDLPRDDRTNWNTADPL